jgi:NAD(P)H-hydrate repair Nnr-like enzyme with NAD(P)H-hydrate epimerase domain
VSVEVFARHERAPGEYATNFDLLFTCGIEFTQYRPDYFEQSHRDLFQKHLKPAAWIVDALFGNGLTRALGSPFDWVTGAVNESGKTVFASRSARA